MITLRETFKINGVLTDVTSVKLSDPTGTFGVKRDDTNAVVVADDTPMTRVSTGTYEYDLTEPADGLTYTYYVEWVYGSETYRDEKSVTGSVKETLTATQIIDRAIQITQRDEIVQATREAILLESLKEISRRVPELKGSLDGVVADSFITKPSDFVMADAFLVNTIPVYAFTYDDYLHDRKDGYVVKGTRIFFRPAFTGQTYSLQYSREHADSIDPIELPNKYFAALYRRVAAGLYESVEQYDRQAAQMSLYEMEITRLLSDMDDEPAVMSSGGTRYRSDY